MRLATRIAWLSVSLLVAAAVSAQQVYVYPQKGQDSMQQQRDEGECSGWARSRTGFDPMQGPNVGGYQEPTQGGVVRGGARGAATGAVVGAIAGDAGKGAAAGAAAGGLIGGMRRNDARRRQASQQDQQMAQYNAAKQEYIRAYSACLEGRGYTVR
jgi:hypothetical protein